MCPILRIKTPLYLICLGILLSSVVYAADEKLPPPTIIDDDVRAEIVPLPPLPAEKLPANVKPKQDKSSGALRGPVVPQNKPDASALQPREPGYATVLSGTLHDGLFDLGPKESPILIRGNLIVAEDATIVLHPGAVIHLRADPKGEKPARAGVPDPTASAAIWVWGCIKAEGVTGNPIEVDNLEKSPASILLYGSGQSRIEGVRLKSIAITQTDGAALWTNCEFAGCNHYALAGGAGIFTHCSFKNCGGIFATYSQAAWSLLARKNIFDGCRECVVLGSDIANSAPNKVSVVIEKNNFVRTRGANLRIMPSKPEAEKAAPKELLIGENWYGSALFEDIEPRLVDRRIDQTVSVRLNTRPPAEKPYADVGAGMTPAILSATQKEQESIQQKLLPPQPQTMRGPSKDEPAAMSRGVKKPK